ncbi:unnamed protein product [Acanthoscelides obtectus]|uniref:Uncharacterized protein n=1 Tax=Acanthoscelides obtectus TaxID=200917 RepID=A0A9P0M0K0_ACAOB|nr:unnamed protein product [Acanthoscelides obtectus]CAK1631290.1 hypothetical protein AOBTE_LOCUS6861 [Acanthoscelides obtectus]
MADEQRRRPYSFEEYADILFYYGNARGNVEEACPNIHLGKVCDIKEGGIVLGCKSKADNLKLLSIAKEKLGDSYVIKEVAGINPRVRIVGLSGEYSDEQIRSYLLKGLDSHDHDADRDKDFIIYYQNTRGLRSKTNEIFNSVPQQDYYSLITLTETWLDADINDCEVFPNNYSVYRSDRKFSALNLRKGGGVAVAVRSEYKSSAIDIYVYPPFNQVFIAWPFEGRIKENAAQFCKEFIVTEDLGIHNAPEPATTASVYDFTPAPIPLLLRN